ncbi:MAG: NAD(P)-dependent alcohol dehydrogenase [Pseudomonadota bacterium]
MKIRAAVLERANAPMQLASLTLAAPGPQEVLVAVSHVGVCHTDIGVQATHPLPAVLGHEGAGEVVACGEAVDELSVGDRVVMTYGSCGVCRNCTEDLPSHCFDIPTLNFSGLTQQGGTTLRATDGRAVHGSFFYQSSFASHALAHQRNTIKVPDDLPAEVLAPLGCGVQTGVGAVVNTLRVSAGSTFVCMGAGSVGLSAVMAAKMVGCSKIIAVDTNADRRKIAKGLGATHVLNGDDSVVGEIVAMTGGGADFCFESAGAVATFHAAIECVRMGGHVGLAAVPNWVEGFHFHPGALAMGRTVTGVLEGSSRAKHFIPKMCEWVRKGLLPVHEIVTLYDFENINDALEDLENGRVIKPVLHL